MKTLHLVAVPLASFLFACGGTDDSPFRQSTPETPAASADVPAPPPDAVVCTGGKDYVGFDGATLLAVRRQVPAGTDRARLKPYDVLGAEYTRVLGTVPASLAGAADTFGRTPARWYEEPSIGGVGLQTAYRIAFDGCLTFVGKGGFAEAPSAANAGEKCGAMTRAFWSRTASPDEIAACADVAVTGSAGESDAPKRWAYACAAVLTSSGFLTY